MTERLGGLGAAAGVAIFALSVLFLHVLQPELSPRNEAVSYYVHGACGWLLTVGLLALGVGSLFLVGGLIRGVRGSGASSGRWLVATWAAGVLLGGAFRADPPGRWSEPPSISGMIHGNAAMLAFLALPVGALCLARSFRRDPRWVARTRALRVLAFAAAISLVLFAASLVPVFVRPGPPILLGLTERVLLAVYACWLATVGFGLVETG
jgi:hypothetical protein